MLALLDSNLPVPENWTVSCVATSHLVASLRVQTEYQTIDHSILLNYVRAEIRLQKNITEHQALAEVMGKNLDTNMRRLQR